MATGDEKNLAIFISVLNLSENENDSRLYKIQFDFVPQLLEGDQGARETNYQQQIDNQLNFYLPFKVKYKKDNHGQVVQFQLVKLIDIQQEELVGSVSIELKQLMENKKQTLLVDEVGKQIHFELTVITYCKEERFTDLQLFVRIEGLPISNATLSTYAQSNVSTNYIEVYQKLTFTKKNDIKVKFLRLSISILFSTKVKNKDPNFLVILKTIKKLNTLFIFEFLLRFDQGQKQKELCFQVTEIDIMKDQWFTPTLNNQDPQIIEQFLNKIKIENRGDIKQIQIKFNLYNVQYDYFDFQEIGLKLNLVIGIDFSYSSKIFHFPHQGKKGKYLNIDFWYANLYLKIIKIIGANILNLTNEKYVLPFGFGAVPSLQPHFGEKQVDNCFSLVGFPQSPEVYEIKGVLAAYLTILDQNIQLDGNTKLSPFLSQLKNIVNPSKVQPDKNYYVCLLIVDGDKINDFDNTKQQLIELLNSPLHIIIIILKQNQNKDFYDLCQEKEMQDILSYFPIQKEDDLEETSKKIITQLKNKVKKYFMDKKMPPNTLKSGIKKDLVAHEYKEKILLIQKENLKKICGAEE